MKFPIVKDFSWAHDHIRVVDYKKGGVLETDDKDLIEVATTEGWIKDPNAKKPASQSNAPVPTGDGKPNEPGSEGAGKPSDSGSEGTGS